MGQPRGHERGWKPNERSKWQGLEDVSNLEELRAKEEAYTAKQEW